MIVSENTTCTLFDAFVDEFLDEQAQRAIIIMGTSKVEDLLFQILNQYLLPKMAKAKDQDELLEGDRPLATFSARIKLVYRLGLIDKTLYKTLENLRDIRNKAAHSFAFDTTASSLREKIANFKKSIKLRNSFSLTKERYFSSENFSGTEELQCLMLSICVILEAIREKTQVTPGNTHTRAIASR